MLHVTAVLFLSFQTFVTHFHPLRFHLNGCIIMAKKQNEQ